MICPLFVALDRLDPTLREASKDLGAGRVRAFVQVTLPLAMPGVVAGLLLVFIPLSGDYITASVLGAPAATWWGRWWPASSSRHRTGPWVRPCPCS